MLFPGRLRRLLRWKREEAGRDGVAAASSLFHPGEARSAEEVTFPGALESPMKRAERGAGAAPLLGHGASPSFSLSCHRR